MTTIAEALAAGLQHHQAGRLDQAEQSYRRVLQAQPDQVDALHLLGLVCHQTNRQDQAIAYIDRALQLQPNFAEARYNLGNVLRACGKLDEALASYQLAVRLKPDYAEAHYNLGNALRDRGQLDEAEASFRRALQLWPGYLKALTNLAAVLQDQRKAEEALPYSQQVVRLQPNSAKAHTNLGSVLRALGRLEEASASQRQALRLDPTQAEVHNNLGAALADLGKLDEALASFQQAIALRPDYASAHFNRAMTLLLRGDWEQGWPEYEWRWRCKEFTPRSFHQPPWDGSPLNGRAILLYSEQGLGDTLHFIRYTALLKQGGGTVRVECPARLHRLLASSPGIDQLLTPGSPLPSFDVHAPLLSLPFLCRTTLATVPAHVPYLFPDEGLKEQWRQQIAGLGGFPIGIAWQGNPWHPKDRQRSIPLREFAPLAEIEGVRLVSLQKGPGSEQLQALAGRFPVVDLGRQLDETAGAFMDTAAVLTNLDLAITSDTALAHLAGALAVPVWVALPFAPDWRWLLERADSPWYPTMRLFRQQTPGDWGEVFRRMARAVQERRDLARAN